MLERTLVFVDTSYLLASFYNSWEIGARAQLEIDLPEVVATLGGMTIDSVSCELSHLRADADTMECEGTGSWGNQPIVFRQVDWIDADGGLRSIAGFTYGRRQDIAADVDAAVASAVTY